MSLPLGAAITMSLLALPLAAPRAETLQDKTEEAERLAGAALTKLLQALDMMMDSVPQYAAPEVLPNGDILIRRIHPEHEPDKPVETDADEGEET